MMHFDIIIIGSGWGTKLRALADEGKTVAIIENSELGGTCLNRGCIPSKMLIYPSDLVTHAREDTKKLHISGMSEPKIDFNSLVLDTQDRISEDSQSIEPIYEKHENITLFKWHAKFVEDKVVEVNEERIFWENIYIATGSVPQIPKIEGLEGTPYMTSKEALQNGKLPEKMIVIWGGYIAVELGHVYGAAWCDVHFLVRSSMIKAEDKDIREVFQKDFSERYNVHFWVSPIKIDYKKNIFYVTLDSWEIMESDALFVATWVTPMTERLWLENTSISTNSRWYIEVNEYLETKVDWVYALWDVVWNYLFRHSVNYEGEYLLREYKNLERKPIEYPPVPHAIFTYPQIAGVGVTEDELIKVGKVEWEDYEIAIHNYKNSAMGSAMKAKVWFVKLIAEKSTGRLIWAHILWEKAAEMIHMLIVLVAGKHKVSFMLDEMIFIHPALPEVIRNAARTLIKKI